MTEQALFILASLLGGERHGYAIARDVRDLSDGRVDLSAGTLYGALNRLTADGMITLDRDDVVDGRRRRYYRLTPAGHAALATEVDRLRSTTDAVGARLGITTRRPRPA